VIEQEPLVSCLMVTANRIHLARRALACLAAQTWQNTELVIVDDGDEDYSPMLAEYADRILIRYHRISRDPDAHLGGLRNLTLDLAKGDYCTQWDDDEWYHPERLAVQMRFLLEHALDAVVLRYVLVHLDEPGFVDKAFRSDSVDGTCGTILHRRTQLRYPNRPKSEDLAFLEQFAELGRVACMEESSSHLFIRCFHGANTWDRKHFHRRLTKTWQQKISYLVSRYVLGDVFRHRSFKLNADESDAFEQLLLLSRSLGLIQSEMRKPAHVGPHCSAVSGHA
jgi:glycosyltransferase involved in cell wall biosynthesis